jgi:hypothetical protein
MRVLKEFGILIVCLMILLSAAGVYTLNAEKNPGVDTRPCYTSPSELGNVVNNLSKRVSELEQKVNKLEMEREHK